MVNVLIASENPVKIQAVQEVFTQFFSQIRIDPLALENSGLKDQPIGEEETYQCSRQRVHLARKQQPSYDYFVGIEGGITLAVPEARPRIILFCSIGNHSTIETVRGCEIPIPPQWYEELVKNNDQRLELGDIATRESGIPNVKQKGGVIGIFTEGRVNRVDIVKQSVVGALIPFVKPDLF